MTWSIGVGRSAKNRARRSGSAASKAALLRAPSSRAARSRRPAPRAVMMTSAPSARARRAVSYPIPALPPMTTTVCPSSSASRWLGVTVGAEVIVPPGTGSPRSWRSRPDRPARRGDLGAEGLQPGEVDLREGRERLDRVRQDVERHAGADRERGLLKPLAGLWAERVGAGQPLAVAEQREEAVRLSVGVRVGGGLGNLGHERGRAEQGLGRARRGGVRVGVG